MATRLVQAVQAVLRSQPLTLRTLAKSAGLTHGFLSNVLAGRRGISPEVAESLAAALEGHSQQTRSAARAIRRALRPRASS